MGRDVRFFSSLDELSRAAANLIIERAGRCIREKGVFTLVLSGGSTPRPLYELLSTPFYAEKLDWRKMHLFWGDERNVAPDDANSNFRMAREAMVSKIPIPPENIYRIPTGDRTAEAVAEEYEEALRRFFSMPAHKNAFPRFDLILLGMGKDGHTASLFPGSPALDEKRKWVLAVDPPDLSPRVARITLTLPVINNGASVLFLVSGSEKHDVLHSIFHSPEQTQPGYPAAEVKPSGSLFCFINGPVI
jgi:6-phosphogluconolactonase